MQLVGDELQLVIMALYDYRDNLQYNDYDNFEDLNADIKAVEDLIIKLGE